MSNFDRKVIAVEQDPGKLIEGAESFEALCQALDRMGEIQDSDGRTHTVAEFIPLIRQYANEEYDPRLLLAIPRTAGLRFKVITLKNLGKLEKDMKSLLVDESFGGNAGNVEIAGKRFSCAAANGYVVREAGEVVLFTNDQMPEIELPEELKKHLADISFRYILGLDEIEKVFGLERIFEPARKMVEDAVKIYNKKHSLRKRIFKDGVDIPKLEVKEL
jgi:hypothetical protein